MLRLAVELCLSGDGLMPIGSCVETFDGAYLAWRWDDVGSELYGNIASVVRALLSQSDRTKEFGRGSAGEKS